MLKIVIAIMVVVLASILTTNVFAQSVPTVGISMSKEIYNFGDKLEYQITVSEVTNDNAVIYITDQSGKKSQLLTIPIQIEYTVVTAQFPFDSIVWNEGKYMLEIEYSGASSTTEFQLVNNGKLSLPFWFTDITMMWINEEATDKDYVRNVILQLIEEGIIQKEVPLYLDEDAIFIPKWYKQVASWWTLGYLSDTELVDNLEFLLEKNIIIIS